MSTQDMRGLREQILANARFLLRFPPSQSNDGVIDDLFPGDGDLHVVVSGESTRVRAMVMLGVQPAIEGGEATSPESALRKLLVAVAEIMSLYIPKIGDHMRNIHGGGIFDVDLIASELKEGQKESKESARKIT
ncbi:hypothetical protein AMS68_007268 [Peltaster fructicola]|uniref:Uncharacterized protein n=1 Tax=Peltaster fructicola TaxID=286661 RepID=A0A6H0Y4A7_9PEZI|nr:hypothetical protein AMS68_007268 [Peltaster fructicola]